MLRVLLVDSNDNYQKVLNDYLLEHGFHVTLAKKGDEAYWVMKHDSIDLIITELDIEIITGYQLIQLAREMDINAVALTSQFDEKLEQYLLSLGCLDVMDKNASMSEILARIQKTMGSNTKPKKQLLYSNGITLDEHSRMVFSHNQEVHLTYTEFELLLLLMNNPFIAFSRQELIERVWGEESGSYLRAIDTHIMSIRKKLNDHAIHSIRGFGYSWRQKVNKR